MIRNIAVLGPGSDVTNLIAGIASDIGSQIAANGFTTVCGGTTGIYPHALKGASANNGRTMAILAGSRQNTSVSGCDSVIFTGSGETFKHAMLANTCDAAIVIGGWIGTMAIAFEFLAQKKTVVFLKGTGAAADTYAGQEIIAGSNIRFLSAGTPAECLSIIKAALQD